MTSNKFRTRNLLFSTLLLAIAAVIFISFSRGSDDYPAVSSGVEVKVHIANGQSGSEIATILQQAGVVKTAKAFVKVALSDPRSRSIAPGTHRIEMHITAKSALHQMLDGKRIIGLINVKEGSTLSDVLALLKENSSISTRDFIGWKTFHRRLPISHRL